MGEVREVTIGSRRYTTIFVLDEPGQGGACHEYSVVINTDGKQVAKVSFQNGPVKENKLNGCHQEDLIAIVIDRLQHFQAGEFKCRENALALTKLEESMHWLNHRTKDREKRGVEGTNIK